MHPAWTQIKSLEPVRESWLRWHPSRLDACVAARGAHPVAPLEAAALDEMRAAHRRWGAPRAALDAVERLGRAETRVVATGQQPAPLGGPLLVLYKTAAAIRLARDLAERHPSLTFVPVFWMASEDHDFEEIRRVVWPGADGALETFALPETPGPPDRMIGPLPLGGAIETLCARIEATTHATGLRASALDWLRETCGADTDLETGFARVLLRWFGAEGLVVVSPLMDWLRRRSVEILSRELERPGLSTARVRARADDMRAAQVEPTLHRAADAVNAFSVDEAGGRHALRVDDGRIVVRSGQTGMNDAPRPSQDWVARLRATPSALSANVVTRPLVQDAALATVAQVVGPGEAAYLAQVEPIYKDFGVFAPVRWPRPQATLIEPRVARRLDKYALAAHDCLGRDAADLTRRVAARRDDGGDLGEVERLRRRHRDEIAALGARPGLGEASLQSSLRKLAHATERGWDALAERLTRLREREDGSLAHDMALLAASLTPMGQPQERVLNAFVPFAALHGLDWPRRLIEALEIAPTSGSAVLETGGFHDA